MTTSASAFLIFAFCLLPFALTTGGAQQVSPQAPPKFTAGVDVVEIDVSVLDKDRKPVRGLKAEDFTVREDGTPRKIVAFDEVYSAPPVPPSAPWMRDVPPDIETNEQAEHNMFAIILDDALLPPVTSPPGLASKDLMAKVARRTVAGLKDGDLAALIFTLNNWNGVNFTGDRSRLLKAVDKLAAGSSDNPFARAPNPTCSSMLGSAQALLSTVEALSSIQHRRKTVFYITNGQLFPIVGPALDCAEQAQGYVHQAMQMAQASNVNINGIDAAGLRPDAGITDPQIQFIQAISENTGGRPIINTNMPQEHVPEIFEDARAYYLIGYELTSRGADSLFHRIDVKVNRPGVEVHTRSTRFEPKPETRPEKTAPPLESAVAGFLPKSDIRLALTTAAFENADGTCRVEIGLTGRLPDPVPGKARDSVSLAVRVFTTDGRAVTSADQTVLVVLEAAEPNRESPAAPKGPTFFLSSDLTLKPGTYSLRLGVHSTVTDQTGSVYSDIVVPDFAKAPLSLSGILMTASSGGSLRGNPLDVLESTAARTFANDDRIQGFLRVYQGGQSALVAVALHVRIVDEHNTAVVDRTETLPAGAFAHDRQADYSIRLPLSSFKPGEYWLAVTAAMGKNMATRDVRFRVK